MSHVHAGVAASLLANKKVMENLYLIDNQCTFCLHKADGLEETYSVKPIKNGYIVTRTIINKLDKTVNLRGLKATLSGISFGKDSQDDYYYANENARLFCTLTVPLDYDRTNDGAEANKKYALPVNRQWNDPGVQEGNICSSPYQPFPAILLSNYKVDRGIVCGSLSQDVFYHNFNVGHVGGKAYLEIFSSFKDIVYREVKSGESFTDRFYIGETGYANDINRMFEEYVCVLKNYLSGGCGSGDTNRHTLIWDSWNDGIYRNVSEEMLVKEAKAVKELFPTVEWFQLDDGYSSYCEENVDLDAHGLCVAYEGEEGIDGGKFPNGLKGYTDKIKEIGLKPSVWIGGLCPIKAKMYREKTEWFFDYKFRIDFSQPLDVSLPEVRDYMCFALDKFILEYGFEGIKHDFWSYAFEERHDLLKNRDRSGYEYREWWLSEMRKRLPEYGYMQTGCDIGIGNPFLGKYFNNYRFGLDVGAGNWEYIKTSMFWALAVLTTHTGDLFIPNSDSIGLLPGLNDDDFMFVINFQIVTRTLVEISGRFSSADKENKRLKVLRRATAYLNNGEDVYLAKYDYRKRGENLPEIIYIRSAFDEQNDGYITVGVFNSKETEQKICFRNSDVGLGAGEHEAEYVWQNRRVKQEDFAFKLKPHGSLLLKIKI